MDRKAEREIIRAITVAYKAVKAGVVADGEELDLLHTLYRATELTEDLEVDADRLTEFCTVVHGCYPEWTQSKHLAALSVSGIADLPDDRKTA